VRKNAKNSMIFAKNNVFFLKNIEKTCVFYDIFGGGFFATGGQEDCRLPNVDCRLEKFVVHGS